MQGVFIDCKGRVMGYSKFMQQLSRGIEGKIVAYDNKDGQNGCVIYVRNGDHAIFVPDEIIEFRRDEAIRLVRQKIDEDTIEAPLLILTDTGEQLMFQAQSACDKLDHQEPSAPE